MKYLIPLLLFFFSVNVEAAPLKPDPGTYAGTALIADYYFVSEPVDWINISGPATSKITVGVQRDAKGRYSLRIAGGKKTQLKKQGSYLFGTINTADFSENAQFSCFRSAVNFNIRQPKTGKLTIFVDYFIECFHKDLLLTTNYIQRYTTTLKKTK